MKLLTLAARTHLTTALMLPVIGAVNNGALAQTPQGPTITLYERTPQGLKGPLKEGDTLTGFRSGTWHMVVIRALVSDSAGIRIATIQIPGASGWGRGYSDNAGHVLSRKIAISVGSSVDNIRHLHPDDAVPVTVGAVNGLEKSRKLTMNLHLK